MSNNSRKLRALPLPLLLTTLVLAWGCDPGTDSGAQTGAHETSGGQAELHREHLAVVANPTPAADTKLELHPSHPEPDRVAPNAHAAFDEVTELIATHYVDGPLSEDELYTAATEGVLRRLIQLEDHKVNTMLSPEELEHLMEGTRGSIVGVGIMIEELGGVLTVRGLVPGGPALDSGLQVGDRILGVDGQRLTDMNLRESVMLIRGEAGTKVKLFVQRDVDEWDIEIERKQVVVSSVESRNFEDGVGYLRLSGFSKTSGEEVGAHLTALSEGGMDRLVLDLRTCPGGLLETAIEVAELFLEPGKRIVTMKHKDKEEHRDAERLDAEWEKLPLVVLVGPHTASGAEILSGALREHERALIVGQQTLGKGTVEAIHDLSNGWALKLSSARFFSPNGVPRQGNGVQPDIPVVGSDAKPEAVAKLSLEQDLPLRAATELLALER